jgi:hypothetical protein
VFHTSRPSTASRSASSGGHASPPKINSRTASSASLGQSAASAGTVDTTVTSRVTNHGPRSIPLRTRERGAGTRQAPFRHASHISSHDASKATDSPASTRSPGPIGLSRKNICASASTNAAALRCVTATPFGVPVDPDVKMIQASSWASGATARQPRDEPGPRSRPSSAMIATTLASPNTNSARSSGSSASTGT